MAAGLVGATATALTGGAGHAAPPTPPSGGVATAEIPDLSAVDHGSAEAATKNHASSELSSAAPARYRVAPGDWMVGIADRFLGDPDSYTRLAALNPQLGADDSRFPDHIEPGWEILLPADAVDRGPRPHATGPATQHPRRPPQPTRRQLPKPTRPIRQGM